MGQSEQRVGGVSRQVHGFMIKFTNITPKYIGYWVTKTVFVKEYTCLFKFERSCFHVHCCFYSYKAGSTKWYSNHAFNIK